MTFLAARRTFMETAPTALVTTALLAVGLAAGCTAPQPEASAVEVASTSRGVGTYSEVTGFGNNPGGLRGYKYVPENMPANAPLVLALHACSQTANDYQNAGWNALADRYKFYVLYPEQQTANNALRCFNWAGEFGDPLNLTRGEGENQSTIQMIDKMKADHSIDARRVFVMGHSGGAAQAALLIATWPDVFAAAGMIAGVPYNCTTTFTQVSSCLSPGINRTAQEWGDRVRAGFPGFTGPWPRVTIWQGTADTTVRPMNQTEILEQWTNAQGIDMTADATAMIDGATRNSYNNAAGTTLVETVTIPNMGHGTPVDPQAMCGQTGAYFLDANICAVARMATFFGIDGAGPAPVDTQAPTVSITAPANNTTVNGSVAIAVSAADDTAVTRVEIAINGTVRQTLMAGPYQWTWATTGLANGQYTIRATAFDAANNSAFAESRVTLSGGAMDTTAPTVNLTAPATGATVSGVVSLTAAAMDDFSVAKVEFLVDGTKVGESANAPYAYSWDSAAVAAGSHRVAARALDAAGNVATDDDTTITVERAMVGEGFEETFSGAAFAPDRPGWSLGTWRADSADHTGRAGSGAITAVLAPDNSALEAKATVALRVGTTDTELVLWRRLVLQPGTAGGSAAFRVVVSSGGQDTTLHETAATMTDVREPEWTQLKLDLSGQAGRDITLHLIVVADDAGALSTSARAWIDDLKLGAPSGPVTPTDTTPPVASFVSPSDGATVSGLITVKVSATDETAVSQVFLFLDGTLIGSDYRGPTYEFLWDTAPVTDGPHALAARAFDAAGNLTLTEISVTVERAPPVEEEEQQGGQPGQVVAGRRYWGCTTMGDPAESALLGAVLVLGLMTLRRRRA